MKKSIVIILAVAAAVLAVTEVSIWYKLQSAQTAAGHADKAYVAAENSNDIAIVDMHSLKVMKRVSLTLENPPEETLYMPHNVQVKPDGSQAWVTGNAASSQMKMSWLQRMFFPVAYAHGDEEDESAGMDQVIIISTITDKVIERIDMGEGLHLAHVVFTPNGRYALVTAQEKGAIYRIDTTSYRIDKTVLTTEGGEPHGLRVSPDGKTAYIAMLGSKSLGILDVATLKIKYLPLNGSAVQAGVSPDGKYAFATVYETKSLAVYDTSTGKLRYIKLPAEAKGPLQLYPTPDSRYVYVADQGYYFDQPAGNEVFKVDVISNKVVATIEVGSAPHGVAVSPDGKQVYVTNMLSNDLSVIDTTNNKELARIPIGQAPNGISLKTNGGITE